MSIVEGALADLPTPILPNIGEEPTREVFIKTYRLISGNEAFVAWNIGGGRHRHLALTMTAEE